MGPMEAKYAAKEQQSFTRDTSVTRVSDSWEEMESTAEARVASRVIHEQMEKADKTARELEESRRQRRAEWEREDAEAAAQNVQREAERARREQQLAAQIEQETKAESTIRKRLNEHRNRENQAQVEHRTMDEAARARRSEKVRLEGLESQRYMQKTQQQVEDETRRTRERNHQFMKENARRQERLQEQLNQAQNSTTNPERTFEFNVPLSKPYEKRKLPSAPPPSYSDGASTWGDSSHKERLDRISSLVQPVPCTKEAWERDQARWKTFEELVKSPGCRIREEDVPFPSQVGIRGLTKDQFKTLALRWHSDKFESRFGERLEPTHRERILIRVKESFQGINSARR